MYHIFSTYIRHIIFGLALISLVNCCDGQHQNVFPKTATQSNKNKENDFVTISLPEYKIDTCLLKLLSAATIANKSHYNPSENFYSLSFTKSKKLRMISLRNEEYTITVKREYTGVIRVRNVLILCKGAIKNDSLFHKNGLNQLRIKLVQNHINSNDIPYNLDPSLQGVFYNCKGMPVFVEIYIEDTIPGYEMKLPQKRSN